MLTASRPVHLRAPSSKARRTKPTMTDRTPLVRSTVPGGDDSHRPVRTTTGAAPSLRGAPSSSAISSSVAGGTNGDPSPDDDVSGKRVLLMAKPQAARYEREQKQAGE